MHDLDHLVERLDRATATHRLLQHPFYRAWAAGTLTRGDLAVYAGQYWQQVEAFPTYLEDLVGRIEPLQARRALEANLRDEVDGDHPGLWVDFASFFGLDCDDLASVPVESETRDCVERFRDACRSAPVPLALGMLYGYESQTPEVAATKMDGLRRYYRASGAALAYFALHGELDVEHSRELASSIRSVAASEDDLAAAEEGARAGNAAIWGLLDGVVRITRVHSPA